MSKKEIIEILRNYKNQYAKEYGIQDIGIFGSVARDNIGTDSDVDIVIRILRPDLFKLAGIKIELEERFNKPVKKKYHNSLTLSKR